MCGKWTVGVGGGAWEMWWQGASDWSGIGVSLWGRAVSVRNCVSGMGRRERERLCVRERDKNM